MIIDEFFNFILLIVHGFEGWPSFHHRIIVVWARRAMTPCGVSGRYEKMDGRTSGLFAAICRRWIGLDHPMCSIPNGMRWTPLEHCGWRMKVWLPGSGTRNPKVWTLDHESPAYYTYLEPRGPVLNGESEVVFWVKTSSRQGSFGFQVVTSIGLVNYSDITYPIVSLWYPHYIHLGGIQFM